MLRICGSVDGVIIEHPHFAGPVRMAVIDLGEDPDVQVARTVELMRRYALEDSDVPTIRAAAVESLRGGLEPPPGVFHYVQSRMRFQTDDATAAALPPLGAPVIEMLVRPVDILQSAGIGDCDDYSMLVAAMLLALGVPCAYVTVAADPRLPDQYSHVYVAAYYRGQRMAIDASHGAYPGWETPNRFGKLREWPLLERSPWQ